MDPTQKKLKQARFEIEEIFRKYDIAGFTILHAPGWGELFWNLWPSYSIIKGDFPEIRLYSKLADFGGDKEKQMNANAGTANMVHHFAENLNGTAPMFQWLNKVCTEKLNAEHEEGPGTYHPDASKDPKAK